MTPEQQLQLELFQAQVMFMTEDQVKKQLIELLRSQMIKHNYTQKINKETYIY